MTKDDGGGKIIPCIARHVSFKQLTLDDESVVEALKRLLLADRKNDDDLWVTLGEFGHSGSTPKRYLNTTTSVVPVELFKRMAGLLIVLSSWLKVMSTKPIDYDCCG